MRPVSGVAYLEGNVAVHDSSSAEAPTLTATPPDDLLAQQASAAAPEDVFPDGSEMGARMRAFDWAATPLGPVDVWPQSLRTAVRSLLTSRFAMWMGWGRGLTFFYNDAYARMTLGKKHPWALGRPTSDVWAEIWADIGPRIERVLETGTATWDEGLLLFPERSGYVEETYHTFSYSPLSDDSGVVAGMLCVVTEETDRVIGARRLASLRDLAASFATVTDEADVIEGIRRGLGANQKDVPFSLLYLFDGDDAVEVSAHLAGCTGIDWTHPAAATPILATAASEPWPAGEIRAHGAQIVVGDLADRFDAIPTGAWDMPARQAAVVPISQPGQKQPAGFLVVGLNPYRQFDEGYAGFIGLVAGQIGASLANARARERERRRAEALAELDRAKTQFFSNVSHEFRTPLTLILGPAEDVLANPQLVESHRASIEVIHRNAMRLLKLVNTLLDFSRTEAGRIDARYEPTDLATTTAEIASSFRSVIEKAGLGLELDCEPVAAAVYVDRDMWEKIVLNLLSNAFKHTFEGSVRVALRQHDGFAELVIEDTGIGISAEQIPRLFERFYRVPNVRSRTHEGTGIGLSLVQELVHLHGGSIAVESAPSVGTTFTVRIPLGKAHLPADRVSAAAAPTRPARPDAAVRAFTAEAARWLPDVGDGRQADVTGDRSAETEHSGELVGSRVLLADDNADMRDYAARLLRSQGWIVETVADGTAALAAARRETPDLVLSDVMMPGLDGFGLLRALRADSRTQTTPVILLSARAGEESRVEGLDRGADDYLVKPFLAQELVARVRSHLSLARLRSTAYAAADRARAEAEAARRDAEQANRAKSDFLAAMSHELRTPLNAIAGYVQLLEMGVHGPMSDSQREILHRVQRSEHHLLSLINDVLNFVKLEAGRVEYDLRTVDLADVVAAAAPIVAPQLESKRIAFDWRVAPETLVWADEDKLRQIVLNLLTNALKFTEPNGRVTVDAVVDEDADVVSLRVSDTGIGIPAEKQQAIFDPFVQVHRHFTRSTEGTGLGLAISRDLARGMGAEVRVQSEVGKGSVFTLTIPRHAPNDDDWTVSS
jgi:signal transduction histidine kinase